MPAVLKPCQFVFDERSWLVDNRCLLEPNGVFMKED